MGLCDPLMIYIKLYFKRSNERCTHNDIWRYFVEWHEPREAADERCGIKRALHQTIGGIILLHILIKEWLHSSNSTGTDKMIRAHVTPTGRQASRSHVRAELGTL